MATHDDGSLEIMAIAAEVKRLDVEANERARVLDLVGRRFDAALAMAIDHMPDRAEALAAATVREGIAGARRALAELAAELGAIVRPLQGMKTADAADRRRILDILANPMAERFPAPALILCATEGVTAEQAIEALRINALAGGAAPSGDPGGERVH